MSDVILMNQLTVILTFHPQTALIKTQVEVFCLVSNFVFLKEKLMDWKTVMIMPEYRIGKKFFFKDTKSMSMFR